MDYLDAIVTIMNANKEIEAIGALSRSAMTKKNLKDMNCSENLNRLYKINKYNKEKYQDATINELSFPSNISL